MRRLISLAFFLVLVIGGLSWSSTPTAEARGLRPLDGSNCWDDYTTYWEHGIYTGRSWTIFQCHNPGYPSEVWLNVPYWFNDVASAICIKSSNHPGWQLTANIYRDNDRGHYVTSYQKNSNGGPEVCWNFPWWANDRMSSAGIVWTR